MPWIIYKMGKVEERFKRKFIEFINCIGPTKANHTKQKKEQAPYSSSHYCRLICAHSECVPYPRKPSVNIFFGIVIRSFYDRWVLFFFISSLRFLAIYFVTSALLCLLVVLAIALSPAFGVYCAVHRNVNKFLEMCTSHQYENTHM